VSCQGRDRFPGLQGHALPQPACRPPRPEARTVVPNNTKFAVSMY